MTKKTRQLAIGLGLLMLASAIWIASRAYDIYMSPVIVKKGVVRLPSDGDQGTLLDSLSTKQLVVDTASLRQAFERLDFDYRSGQFELSEGMTAKALVRHFRLGKQKEERVVLTYGRVLGDVVKQAVRFVEVDSASLHEAILDSNWLDSVGLSPQTAISIAIPNTYSVYWNSTAHELRNRLHNEMKRFWQRNNRKAKADSLGLSPLEVYTLASIVESETKQNAEKPRVAGVYLNRLQRGIKLDADPTVVFAIGDFEIRRVLFKHLEYDSPYNTYLYAGLPPGPIAMPTISSIDAVLNPETHDYLFFVTKGDGSGTHSFARDMTGHSRNIRKFQQTLRERGIRR